MIVPWGYIFGKFIELNPKDLSPDCTYIIPQLKIKNSAGPVWLSG